VLIYSHIEPGSEAVMRLSVGGRRLAWDVPTREGGQGKVWRHDILAKLGRLRNGVTRRSGRASRLSRTQGKHEQDDELRGIR
jgi:hypothetical protein